MRQSKYVIYAEYKKHLDGDWRTVHNLWRHIRNYTGSYGYSETEVDAFFAGESGGKKQVDFGNVIGLTQGSVPFASAGGALTEDNANFNYVSGTKTLSVDTLAFTGGSILDSSGAISFGNENLSTTGKIIVGHASNADCGIYNNSTAGDNSVVVFYPNEGTNVTPTLLLCPKGTGSSASLKSQFSFFNTDYIADSTNYEVLVMRSIGSGGYTFNSLSGGTGTTRSINWQTNSITRLTLDILGNFGIKQTSFGTNAVGVLAQGTGTAPTSSPADCFQMYSADIIAGHAAFHIRNENNTIIKLYQQAHIIDADGNLADITTKFNTLLSYLENNGLLASA